ncbi:hypothetical protein P2G88_13625 [Aliiglaciecola sp. CAU 1673]|uniref:hypothetical protein n=1 Tax=Aliiglaciecola sp. CAU 1673 TaxID=3032595 RepID=UPI0023D9DCBE|nr:hypothetical protein [Aliiglaciecola sp. CAU 1673]MDF2179295.1 hypothetical protein [Aliiglaciecola sp. CAU 1673]
MVLVSLLGLLVLTLIYFVVRSQNLQRQLYQYKAAQKAGEAQFRFTLGNTNYLAHELQRTFVSRLEKTHRHGLIKQEDYDIALFILSNFANVVMLCCEKQASVQEAVNRTLNKSSMRLETLNHFISQQPSQIKMVWIKNQLNGYISACNQLSMMGQLQEATAEETEKASA